MKRPSTLPPLPALPPGLCAIAGVDEVGRGPLAGPVVAAAVILPPEFNGALLADSKALSKSRREWLAALLRKMAAIGIASIPSTMIDQLNIRQASLLAMRQAVLALPIVPDFALIDGRDRPTGLPCPAEAIIKGDARVPAISAASIIAKVARDAMMDAAAESFPGFGFEQHAGYPTPFHQRKIIELGLTPIHRLSFAPCRQRSLFDGAPFENGTTPPEPA